MAGKVNRNEFLRMVAKRTNMQVEEVRYVYDSMCEEMQSIILEGKELSLTGFGTFTLRRHKGHPVQFDAKGGSIKDYVVLKFVPSVVLVSKIRGGISESVLK